MCSEWGGVQSPLWKAQSNVYLVYLVYCTHSHVTVYTIIHTVIHTYYSTHGHAHGHTHILPYTRSYMIHDVHDTVLANPELYACGN